MMARQHMWITAGVVWVLTSAGLPIAAHAQETRPAELRPASAIVDVESQSAALAAFDAAIQQYLKVRESLATEIPPLRVTDNVAEIDERSDMLALAIQRARPNALQGEFFSPAVARAFHERLTAALREYDIASLLGLDDPDERSEIRVLRTNTRFPNATPLATMPAAALQALPPLPDALEYRFVGTDLILRDRNARLILDYIPGVLQSR